MPHKHKRKRGDDEADFNLPPSQRARPLPVGSKNGTAGKDGQQKGKKGKKGRKDNDAPRAFRRLMAVAHGKKVRSGLDDGTTDKPTKKETSEELKIRPGEDLRSFAHRVDAALPVAGLTKKTVVKDGKDESGLKVYRTRKEKKMHKLYDQWRAEERKIQDQREEEADEAIGRELDEDPTGTTALAMAELNEATSKRSRRKRGKAQAPPELNKSTSRQLKVGDATADVGNIPKAAGSLKRREELQEVRADVMEAYRKIREHEQAKLMRA
ncbi:hypothetical protein NM208_g3222 [Fusarium decemcellulare]|uniref:Uncharacterized protein n=1 Tax=Fusarium decemcellulare TaxID=57161 RepID=A0ACC1SPS4_9HYPO|nr:hypothetical protein NM208_g3222 [Fusarium decemcellulare]